MEIKPSIAHRLAEIAEEINRDKENNANSDLLEWVYRTINREVFNGATSCTLLIGHNFSKKSWKIIKKFLKKQKFKVNWLKSEQKIKISWKKSWLISVLKSHQ